MVPPAPVTASAAPAATPAPVLPLLVPAGSGTLNELFPGHGRHARTAESARLPALSITCRCRPVGRRCPIPTGRTRSR
jgi:hypothetical protein